MKQVKVYGADWCHDTIAVRQSLDSRGVPYQYLNVDQDSTAAEWVKAHNDGKQKLPTLEIGRRVLTIPSEDDLEEALRSTGMTS